MINQFVCIVLICWFSTFEAASLPHSSEEMDEENRLFDHSFSLFIAPGTLWCGAGNVSNTADEVGLASKTDACCKAHDKCPENIDAGKYKYGLHNSGKFTRSHCDCDSAFYHCLKAASTSFVGIANTIGNAYFTILGPMCFEKVLPIIKCNKEKFGRCIDYELESEDSGWEPVYQWFDNPTFF